MAEKNRQTDGRLARSQRTRELIVEAHRALLAAGTTRPTAAMISQKAGVSIRTLWSNFSDMEALLLTTVDQWLAEDEPRRQTVDPDLPIGSRIEQFCDERLRRLEHVSPIARASEPVDKLSVALQSRREKLIAGVRAELQVIFAAELAASEVRDELLDAMTMTTSWAAWSLLRHDLGLSPERARGVMESALRSLVAP